MNQNNQLTILEFSRLTGIKRENLRFYDRIGLLSPEMRGKNKYRYYSRSQLNMAYLIGDLRRLGMGIETIKQYASCRTPLNTLELFDRQSVHIQDEIRILQETALIMQMHSNMIHEALAHTDSTPFLEKKESETIFLCPSVPEGMNEDDGGIFSYEYAEAHGINLGFPYGTFLSQKNLESGDTQADGRLYLKVGNGGNTCKPQGLYAVAYDQCNSWNTIKLYKGLSDFIKDQGLSICGDAYEEYPLGDITEPETERYCVRVEIPVI